MKKAIGFAMVLFLMTGLAQAQSFKQVKTADDFLAELKASMKDPDSFILEASYIKIWTPEVIAEEEKTLAVDPISKRTNVLWRRWMYGLRRTLAKLIFALSTEQRTAMADTTEAHR